MTEHGDPGQGAPSPWSFHEPTAPTEPTGQAAGPIFGGTRSGAIPPLGSPNGAGSPNDAGASGSAVDDAGSDDGGSGHRGPDDGSSDPLDGGGDVGDRVDADHFEDARRGAGRHSHGDGTPSGFPEAHYYAHPDARSPQGFEPSTTAPEPQVQPGQFPSGEFGSPFGLPPDTQAPPQHAGAPADQAQDRPPQYDQPQYGQPQYDQPQDGQPQYDQPLYGQPQYGQPQYGQPQYGQPQYGQPQYGQPQYGQPQYAQAPFEQPQLEQPQFEQPHFEQPQHAQPQFEQPQYGQAQYGKPQYGQPQYAQPQYGQPQYAQPLHTGQQTYPAAPPGPAAAGPGPAAYATAPQVTPAAVPVDDPPAPRAPVAQPRPESLLAPSHRASTSHEAQSGWQGRLRRISGGVIKPAPSTQEMSDRKDAQDIQRTFSRPMTIVVVQPKGGGGKTPATIGLASALGALRGGYVVGWDDNETRGTLAVRVDNPDGQTTTVWDLLRDLPSFERTDARVGDLSHYVRGQGAAQFDALVSDDSPGNMAQIGEDEFRRIHAVLQRFYRQIVIDTGNNVRSPNWQAAVNAADQIVVVSTYQRDVGYSGSWVLDHLIETGRSELAASAITVLSAADPRPGATVRSELIDHFSQRTRTVVEIPYDPLIALGGPIEWTRLKPETRRAWTHAGAAVVSALAAQDESERVANR